MNDHPIQRIAVIGAGLMGHGIALDFAVADYDVRLHDLTAEALSRAQESIATALQRLEELGLITVEQRSRALERIRCSVNLSEVVADADLVIESATENLEVKRRIFAELDRLCPAHTILASNSSSLVPSSYASATQRPAWVLGVHYFNPPYLLPGVEVVAGPETTTATVQTVREFLLKLGKQVVVSFTSQTQNGETRRPLGRNAAGSLLYTASGHMAVVLAQADRAPFAMDDLRRGTPEEKATAFDSCLAYFGTFEVGEGHVIHRIEHCTFPNWIGTAQTRFFEFNGDRLTLQTPPMLLGGQETISRLIWEKVKP